MEVKRHEQVVLMQPDPMNYAYQHGMVGQHDREAMQKVGAWRWPLIHQYGPRIIELLSADHCIDFGGYAAPVGYGAVVVDYQNDFNKPRSLLDVPPNADVIFSSHTLEHMTDVKGAIQAWWCKLKPGGHVIVQVPSWNKENLRAENWAYHEATFCFEWEETAPLEYIRLDGWLKHFGFEIEVASHDYIVGDPDERPCNMLIIARKR